MKAKKGRSKTTTPATRSSQSEVKPKATWLEYTSDWIKSQISTGGFSMKNEDFEVVKVMHAGSTEPEFVVISGFFYCLGKKCCKNAVMARMELYGA